MFSLYRTRTIKPSTWFAFCGLDHSISSSNIYPGLSHCSDAVNPVSPQQCKCKASQSHWVLHSVLTKTRPLQDIWFDMKWFELSQLHWSHQTLYIELMECNLRQFVCIYANSEQTNILLCAHLNFSCMLEEQSLLLTLQHLFSNVSSRYLTDYIMHEAFFFLFFFAVMGHCTAESRLAHYSHGKETENPPLNICWCKFFFCCNFLSSMSNF